MVQNAIKINNENYLENLMGGFYGPAFTHRLVALDSGGWLGCVPNWHSWIEASSKLFE
jgi:hypothetical protein